MPNPFGTHRKHIEICTSTNLLAAEWAKTGAPEGAVVSTDFQTAGRGRLGRAWDSDLSHNLMFSLVLRPVMKPEDYGQVVLVAAVAVSEALSEILPPDVVQIKWPNDVLLARKKVCGMIIETISGTDALILGIGLNVNQSSFSEALHQKATSLAIFSGKIFDREVLLGSILNSLETHLHHLYQQGVSDVRRRYLATLAGLGERITLREGQEVIHQGILAGVNERGHLMVMEKGGIRVFVAGEVSLSDFYTTAENPLQPPT
ncbi:MAG: biotin--[acetyl-CoA-carboxylase] ligase [Bacteroidetes Order II. Incertae sedis bacterium]|nr:biotin--[acetyl-CoA-carboxylase] ligase [Bacteroidetes Order II. bacterium]